MVLQVVELQGYGGAARLCRRCTLVRAEHVVLLRSLSSVGPLPFRPLPDTELLPCVCPACFTACAPLFSAALALLHLFGCRTSYCQGQCPRVSVMHLPIGPKDGQGVLNRGNLSACRSRIDPAPHWIQYKGLSPRYILASGHVTAHHTL